MTWRKLDPEKDDLEDFLNLVHGLMVSLPGCRGEGPRFRGRDRRGDNCNRGISGYDGQSNGNNNNMFRNNGCQSGANNSFNQRR